MGYSKQHSNRAAVWLALLLTGAHAHTAQALGFGGVHVDSALDQPLDARIELVSVDADERRSLSVRIAAPAMFKRFDIQRVALHDALQAELVKNRGAHAIIHVTTRTPVHEPYLRFLVEADTQGGRALHAYTVLLDPPDRMPRVAARAPGHARPDSASVDTSATNAAPAKPRRPAPVVTEPRPQQNRYGPVKAGDTLWEIASHLRRGGATLDQMQVAIYQANPHAFRGAMNRLRRGATLSIPAADTIVGVDRAKARATVAAASHRRVAAIQPDARPATGNDGLTTSATLKLQAPSSQATGAAPVATPTDFGQLAGAQMSNHEHADAPVMQMSDAAGLAGEGIAPAPRPDAKKPDSTPEPIAPPRGRLETVAARPASAAPAAEAAEKPIAASFGDGLGRLLQFSNDGDSPWQFGADTPDADSPARDVVATRAASALSPRNLGLLLLAGLIGSWLWIAYRRRQYPDVALTFADDAQGANDHDGDSAGADEATLDPTAAAAPAAFIETARHQTEVGLVDQARETLERGLAQHPDHPGLQDKRIELDYDAGAPDAFGETVERFRDDLAGSAVRWAGIAAMARSLLGDDASFANPPGAADAAPVPTSNCARPAGTADAADGPATAGPVAAAREGQPVAAPEPRLDNDAPHAPVSDPAQAQATAGTDSLDAGQASPDEHATSAPADFDTATIALDDGETIGDTTDDTSQAGDSPDSTASAQASLRDDAATLLAVDSTDTELVPQRPAATPPADDESEQAIRLEPIDANGFDLSDARQPQPQDPGQDDDSVDMRLDLARMYMDMDDHAAARELLEQARAVGDDTQRDHAAALLAEIAPA